MPVAFQGRPEDDWTLEPRFTPLIIGGQVQSFLADLHTEFDSSGLVSAPHTQSEILMSLSCKPDHYHSRLC